MATTRRNQENENTETTAPTETPAATPRKRNKPVFSRKVPLAMPTYSIKELRVGDSLFVRVDADPVTKPQLDKNGEPKLDPDTKKPMDITTVVVTDLLTGEQGSMVCPFIVRKAFEEFRENNEGIVGHCFELIKGKKSGRTNEYSVYEIEVPKTAE